MANKEPESWITVNGRHIPIGAGESKAEAINKALNKDADDKERQIQKNKEEADRLNKPAPEKEITQKDIENKLLDKSSYTKDEEYIKASAEVRQALKERQELNEKLNNLREQLKSEQSIKPKDQWTVDDEINAMLGSKPMSYTEKGEQLKKEYDATFTKYREADRRWSELSNKHQNYNEKYSEKQREQYLQNSSKYGDVKPATKAEYRGFEKAYTSTASIDAMIKDGRAKVVEMSPERYLREIAHNIFHRSTIEKAIRGVDVKSINKYMKMMKKGTKFHTPYLNYSDKGQEGRHRAIAAMMLGIKKIPVVIVDKKK